MSFLVQNISHLPNKYYGVHSGAFGFMISARVVHNTLMVRVCATYIDGFLGPKFSEQESFSADFPQTCMGLARSRKRLLKWVVLAKIHHKIGYKGKFW